VDGYRARLDYNLNMSLLTLEKIRQLLFASPVKGMNDIQFGKDLTGFLDTFPGARLCPRTGYEGLASWQNLSGLPFALQVRVFQTGFGMW
jgi:hypothetical protein